MHQCYKEENILNLINKLLDDTEFARGEIRTPFYRYIYLIEGWKAECIAEEIIKENGGWDDDEYISGLIEKKHDEVFKTDFEQVYEKFKVLKNEIVGGCQFGVSVIVIKFPISDKRPTGYKVLTFEPSVE